MTRLGLRARVLLLAVLPVLLATVLLAAILVYDRLKSEENGLLAFGDVLARQVAASAEYGLFSGNTEYLVAQSRNVLHEAGVVGVQIRDRSGEVVVRVGAGLQATEVAGLGEIAEGVDRDGDSLRITRFVQRGGGIDDVFVVAAAEPADFLPIGAVELSLSFVEMRHEGRRMVMWTAAIAAAIAIVAMAMALRFGAGLTRPLRHLSSAIERIGGGDLAARVDLQGGEDFERLATGVNRMALKLAAARADLQQQIDDATLELAAKKREAELANEAKSRFLAAASHDLRQPLHALGLFAAQLVRLRLPGEAGQLAARIDEASESLARLLDSLLDISRLDSGALRPERRNFALAPVFARIAGEFAGVARERGLRLRVRAGGLWVNSDPMMFERIVVNLLANALRYTEHGSVLLAARRTGREVRVEVRDSGPGIPEKSQALVFSEFVQLDNPERDHRKGLGLGLAIVGRLCNLLEHRLGLRSAPGRGSLFWFALPRAAVEPAHEAREGNGESVFGEATLAGRVVLLVEDEPAIRAGMTAQLASWGCRVVAAGSAEELLGEAGRLGLAPDVLVCDNRAGGEPADGIALIETIRARLRRPVPAVVVSGDTGSAARAQAAAYGVPLLAKPVRPAKLRAALESLLKSED